MKVLTALGNPILNMELKNYRELDVLSNDLQYQDAIIEFLEKEKNIDYIILSEVLSGNRNIEEIVDEIYITNKNINIIVIAENKNKDLERLLKEKKIKKIFINNKIEINDIVQSLRTVKTVNLENNIKQSIFKNNRINNGDVNHEKNNIITILGNSGSGKSIFSVNLAKTMKNNKVLIIDFDILNNSIHTILGVKKLNKNENLKNEYIKNIVKINNKLDLISGTDLMFKSNKLKPNNLLKIINKLKKDYDYIIIDTSSECFFDYNKALIKSSYYSIFLLEGNLLEIKKANRLLEIYTNNWNIEKEKIKIVLNKYNSNSIDVNILKDIFSKFELVGILSSSDYYNKVINSNYKLIINNKLKKDYIKVLDRILNQQLSNKHNIINFRKRIKV